MVKVLDLFRNSWKLSRLSAHPQDDSPFIGSVDAELKLVCKNGLKALVGHHDQKPRSRGQHSCEKGDPQLLEKHLQITPWELHEGRQTFTRECVRRS